MIDLPDYPGPAALSWTPIDFGGVVGSELGGSDQRINRLGNRWAVTVTMPPLTPQQALEWSAALVAGVEEGVRWPIIQVGASTGSPGAALVDGASQGGKALDVDGVTPGYVARRGMMVAVVTASKRYCYKLASTTRANSAGELVLNLTSGLRVSPTDNDSVELAAPKIEGFLTDAPSWGFDANRLAQGFAFTIRERR